MKVWDILLPVAQLVSKALVLLSASEFQSTHRNNGFAVMYQVMQEESDVPALKFNNEGCSLQWKEQNQYRNLEYQKVVT